MSSMVRASAATSPRSPLQEAPPNDSVVQETADSSKPYGLRKRSPKPAPEAAPEKKAARARSKPRVHVQPATPPPQPMPPSPQEVQRRAHQGALLPLMENSLARANLKWSEQSELRFVVAQCRRKYALLPGKLIEMLKVEDNFGKIFECLATADKDAKDLQTLVQKNFLSEHMLFSTFDVSQIIEPFGTDLAMIALRFGRHHCAYALLRYAVQKILVQDHTIAEPQRMLTELMGVARLMTDKITTDENVHSLMPVAPGFTGYLDGKNIGAQTGEHISTIMLRFIYQGSLAFCFEHFDQSWLWQPSRLKAIMDECIDRLEYPTHNEHHYIELASLR